MSVHARAKVPVTDASSMLAPADPSSTVQIELAGGGIMTISLAQALNQGLVRHAANGSWSVVPGKATRLRMVSASAASVMNPGQPAPPASTPENSGVGMHAILGMESGGDDKKPKAPSEVIGNIASLCFLTHGLLEIAKGPGMPGWQTVYFAAHGLNHYTNNKLLPEWLAKGPVKDSMEYAIIGGMLVDSFKGLPKANAGFAAAAQSASHVTGMGAKAMVFAKGALKKFPAEAAPVAKAATKDAANVPFLSKLFPMLKPLYYIGMTASSVSSIVGTTEYLREHGTKGLVHTTSGRDSVIGALSGAAMLGAMYMPASPVQMYVDFASSALWMLQELNGHGVFDGLLGGDPKEAPAAAAGNTGDAKKPEDAAAAAKASETKPAAAALASSAVAGMAPSSEVPSVAIPTSRAARRRRIAA